MPADIKELRPTHNQGFIYEKNNFVNCNVHDTIFIVKLLYPEFP